MREIFLMTPQGPIKGLNIVRRTLLKHGVSCEILRTPRSAIRKVRQCFNLKYKYVPRLKPLRVADISIDPESLRARKGNLKTRITRKEYDLFKFFADNKNKIMNRNTILENVWGDAPNPFTNTVDVHIASLRRKLNIPEGHILKTVHGMGYTLQI